MFKVEYYDFLMSNCIILQTCTNIGPIILSFAFFLFFSYLSFVLNFITRIKFFICKSRTKASITVTIQLVKLSLFCVVFALLS